MEYLMTYGWAILIIAIVLVALFSLGVFNSANFTPKAPPGSCQVFRPNGPGTTFDLNLEGECNGELPQYVAQFNGASSGISIQPTSGLDPQSITVSAWASLAPVAGMYGVVTDKPSAANGINIYMSSSGQNVGSLMTSYAGGQPASYNTWYYLVATYNPMTGNDLFYVNGQYVAWAPATAGVMSNSGQSTVIGEFYNYGYDHFDGMISNVQIYNFTMPANDIQTLYNEGIGGAPIDITNLVGWWPLNGNAQDYSGNQNNGVATSVVYTTSWGSTYTQP